MTEAYAEDIAAGELAQGWGGDTMEKHRTRLQDQVAERFVVSG